MLSFSLSLSLLLSNLSGDAAAHADAARMRVGAAPTPTADRVLLEDYN